MRRKEEIDESPQHHVIESIDPKWCQQEQERGNGDQDSALLVLRAQSPDDERGGLPDAAHDENPAECFAVDAGLGDVRYRDESVEDREDEGGNEGGVVVVV